MRKLFTPLLFVFLLSLPLLASAQPALAQTPELPQVRAILFFSPTCTHCHKVMTEDLPPLQAQYGSQLAIIEIDVSTVEGDMAWSMARAQYNVPDDRIGVPFLLIGGQNLVGSLEIPEILPRLIREGLAAGGVDWPDFPGVQAYIDEFEANPQPAATAQPVVAPSLEEVFQTDPVGNSLAVIVLLGLVVTSVWNIRRYAGGRQDADPWPAWVDEVLITAGLIVAGYLTWVELSLNPALCGPVGDCNAVQQSEYARLFGLIPVGLLGLAGYALIGAGWLANDYFKAKDRQQLHQIIWWMALFGVGFSIYLTFLEPFIIGASCLWCLTSAVLMALVFWQATSKYLAARSGHHKVHRRRKKGNNQ